MPHRNYKTWLLATILFLGTASHAEDIDIFTNPTSSGSASTNLLVMIDSAGSINAQTTDLDGTSKKVYQVAGNVIRALLDPGSLKIKKSIFPATSIITTTTPSCTKSPVATSGCSCEDFGYVADTDTAFCKLPADRATKLQTLIQSVNFGVMLFNGSNSSGANGAAQKGGYVAFNVSSMSDEGNRNQLITKLNDIPTGNGSMYSMSMYEAYRYFTNGVAENGFDGSTGYSTTTMQGFDRRACFAGSCTAGAKYAGPITANSCNNAIVVIGPGSPDNSNLETTTSYLSGIGGSTTVIPTGSSPNYDSNMFDEYARSFASKDFNPSVDGVQPVATYTIMNDPSPSTRSINFMKSAAYQGGGAYFESKNAVDFLDAFVIVLTKVQSVNSAFASVALPVSVNVRGTNLNQVYVGMFRPDKDGKPRWFGNMKEYQLKYDSGTNDVYLAGSDGLRAETSSSQLLSDTAISFWTHSSSYWNFSPSGTPPSGNDSPDGSVVEKGGAAQMAREQFATRALQDTRKVYTCIDCASPTDLADTDATLFKHTNTEVLKGVLKGLIPPASVTPTAEETALAANVVNWCRGDNTKADEGVPYSTTQVRPSFYGDVLHSRPAVINYNRSTTCGGRNDNDVFVYYGSNDGMFKATKGGDNLEATGGGKEAWAFVPSEFFADLNKLYENSATTKKPYFVDGSVGSYVQYATTICPGAGAIQKVSKAHVYPTMRRGGRFMYALDVSPTSGAASDSAIAPRFLWKISNATPGFSELGQTWSEPKTAKVKIGGVVNGVDNSVIKPVLIFGGGYDAAVEDIANGDITSSSESNVTTLAKPDGFNRLMGRAIYMVHAETGELLWRASKTSADCPATAVCKVVSEMHYAIPSDISILDYDRNGFVDRLYFGDTGANLWRVDVGNTSTDLSNMTVTKLAQFNAPRGSETDATSRRKFLYAPDVVQSAGYLLVLIGSGDREQPFDKTVINRFYAIKDTGAVPTAVLSDAATSLLQVSASNIATGVTLSSTSSGWFYTMAESGEKIVSSPVTLNGISFFNSNTPRSGCATGLGEARIYGLNYETGKATVYTAEGQPSAYKTIPGGGYLPGGVPAVVDVGGGNLREVLIVGTKVSQETGVVQLNRRVRTYWKKSIDQK